MPRVSHQTSVITVAAVSIDVLYDYAGKIKQKMGLSKIKN